MSNAELITKVEEIVAHRLTGEAAVSDDGRWIVWGCGHSAQTMAKFVDRVKARTRQPAFFRAGRFGVLASE